jgi:hypothetical protein
MAVPSSQNSGSQVKRALLLAAVLCGAMSTFSLLSGRPGDMEAGLIGAGLGGLFVGGVVAVELLGRSLVRKGSTRSVRQPRPLSFGVRRWQGMEGEPATESRVYHVGTHLLVVVGIFAALFAVIGLFIAVKQGDWSFLAIVILAAGGFVLLLQVLRLEIGPTRFKYRNLSGSREVAFADVSRAYFDVVRSDYAPQGAARFWVERRAGGRVKVNLRTFPTEAAAVLFTALEGHGIQIEVPEAWAARRMAEQVRAAQSKLRA